MTDEFGSPQEAAMHVRRADSRWQAAVHGFDPYPDRLRRLAEAAEAERKALLFADLCNVKWKPQPGARGLRLAAELDPGNRLGPEKLWAKFDEALDQLGDRARGRRLRAAGRGVRFAIGRGERDRRRARADRPDQRDRVIKPAALSPYMGAPTTGRS